MTDRLATNPKSQDGAAGGDTQAHGLNRRSILLGSTTLAALSAAAAFGATPSSAQAQQRQQSSQAAAGKKPNMLIIWGDDIGMWDIRAEFDHVASYPAAAK